MSDKSTLYKVIASLIEKQGELVKTMEDLIRAHYGESADCIIYDLETSVDNDDCYVCFHNLENAHKRHIEFKERRAKEEEPKKKENKT